VDVLLQLASPLGIISLFIFAGGIALFVIVVLGGWGKKSRLTSNGKALFSILATVFTILGYLGVFLTIYPAKRPNIVMDRWVDLGLNLLTEAVGIFVTVFLIDRIIKKREEARWKPSKNIVYYRLTELVWYLFVNFSPPSLHKDLEPVEISFGGIDTGTVKDISSLDLDMFVLEPFLQREWADQLLGPWLAEHRTYMTEAKNTLDGIINDSTVFLEPEVLSLIFLLKQEVDNFLLFLTNILNVLEETDETYLRNWASYHVLVTLTRRLLAAAQMLEKWLIQQCTRKRTLNEIYDEVLAGLDGAIDILEKQRRGTR
jgi:hypothetical protein